MTITYRESFHTVQGTWGKKKKVKYLLSTFDVNVLSPHVMATLSCCKRMWNVTRDAYAVNKWVWSDYVRRQSQPTCVNFPRVITALSSCSNTHLWSFLKHSASRNMELNLNRHVQCMQNKTQSAIKNPFVTLFLVKLFF